MFQQGTKAVAAAGIVILIMALLPPAIFGPHPPASGDYKDLGDGWATIIYNYQTLITGMLAVGAAFVTIMVSQRSHNEIVALTLRADKMRIEQALVPHYYFLRFKRQELAAFQDNFGGLRGNTQALKDMLISRAGWLYEALARVKEIMGSKGFVAGEPLFNGEMLYVLEKVRVQVDGLMIGTKDLRDAGQGGQLVWRDDELVRFPSTLIILERDLEILLSQMRSLADEYRLKLNHDLTP
jgi:hypothetical protein